MWSHSDAYTKGSYMPGYLKPIRLMYWVSSFYCLLMPFTVQSNVSDFNLVRQELEYKEAGLATLERLKSHVATDYNAGITVLSNKLKWEPLPLHEKINLYKTLIYLHFSFDEPIQVINYANDLLALVRPLPNPRYANFARLVLIAEANNVSRDSRLKKLDKFSPHSRLSNKTMLSFTIHYSIVNPSTFADFS